jgi:hypothetical protein
MKYTKKNQNNPKFEQGVSNNVFDGFTKNEAKKQKTKINSPSAICLALGEETLPRVPGTRLSGKAPLSPFNLAEPFIPAGPTATKP